MLLIVIVTMGQKTYAQHIFHQDIIRGGITAAGFSTGQSFGSGTFDIYIEPGSTIKKALAFAYSLRFPPPATFTLNGNTYTFDSTNLITNVSVGSQPVPYISPIRLYCKEITNDVLPSVTNYTVTIPDQFGLQLNEGIWTFFLVVIYENPLMDEVCYNIIVNNTALIGYEHYSLNNLNPIDNNSPVGFSIYSDRVCTITDGTDVYVNSTSIGTIDQVDQVNNFWSCSGVKGHFYYQNGTLFGLDDDTPDNIMGGGDALADISTYLPNNTTSLDFRLSHINYPNVSPTAINMNLAYFLTYTTPCSSFPTALTVSDTTICEGESLQLGASGGINYDWLPQTGLSCYDCPNPAFTGDSSTVYTVRIWSTDSCSKVLPVYVKVNPKPKFESIQVTPSGCGKSTGSIVAMMDTAQAPYQYTLDNQAPQPDSAFTGLVSGNYVLSVENVHGCTNDTLLTVHEELSVTASFIANPATGSAPLWVQTENTSTNATDYLWEWSGGTTTDEHPGFTLDTAGNYTLTLIAYDGAPHCSDTFSLQVLVYDSLQVSIPNVFTPNQDGRNDFFGITTNVSVSGRVALFNRWGTPLHELEFTTQPQVFEPLWDGTDTSEGVYFYQLELTTNTETYSYSGFVQLVR